MSAPRPRDPERGLRSAIADLSDRVPALVDLYRLAQNPAWEAAGWRDHLRVRRETSFLRGLPASDPTGTALLALYRDDVFDTKTGLALLTALRMAGLSPVLLRPSPRATRAARLARAHGVTQVHDWEQSELSATDHAAIEDATSWFRAQSPDFGVVRAWRFQGMQAGAHVLSTVIRLTFEGDPDLDVPAVRRLTEQVLGDVVANYRRAEQILDRFEPTVVLLEEANYSLNGPLVDLAVARGIDVVQSVAIWKDDVLWHKRLTSDTRRTEVKSVERSTLDELERTPWTDEMDQELEREFDERYGAAWVLSRQFQPDTRPITRADLESELGLDPAKPTAVIFAHVLWDASLFYGEDLFANYGDWLGQTLRAAGGNSGVNWIVKTHPANTFRSLHGDVVGESRDVAMAHEVLPSLPDHVTILHPDTHVSTRSLFEHADVGLTVRGTTGLEMACHAKTVLTAGTGHYTGLGFTTDSVDAAQYLERVGSLDTVTQPTPEASARRPVLRTRALLPARSPRSPGRGAETRPVRHVNLTTVDLTRPLEQSLVRVAGEGDLDHRRVQIRHRLETRHIPDRAAVRHVSLRAVGLQLVVLVDIELEKLPVLTVGLP